MTTKNMSVRMVKKRMLMKITMCRQISEDVVGTHSHYSLLINHLHAADNVIKSKVHDKFNYNIL